MRSKLNKVIEMEVDVQNLESIIKVEKERFEDEILVQEVHTKAFSNKQQPLKGRDKKNNKGRCQICKLEMLRSSLMAHIERVHESFACRECRRVYKSHQRMKTHLFKVHYNGQVFDCHCGKLYQSSQQLKSHQRDNHLAINKFCELCNKTFSGKRAKFLHWKEQHSSIHGHYMAWKRENGGINIVINEGVPFTCDKCGKVFPNRKEMSRHFVFFHNRNPFVCDLCPRTFGIKFNLQLHMMKSHLKIKPFECTVCGSKHAVKRSLVDHMQTHNEKKEKCTICNRYIASLKSHMRETHDRGKKPCKVCKKMLYNNKVTRHMKTHAEKPKPFKCDECDEAFTLKKVFNEHRNRVHNAEVPMTCHCGMQFKHHQKLIDHQKSHTSSFYPCTVCDRKYRLKGSLTVHLRHKHSKNL